MKFYGNGMVWDVENDKVLCEFRKGELETDDERIISILQRRYENDGRKTEQGDQEGPEIEEEQMTYNDLKTLAKDRGIAVGHKTKAKLLEDLQEVSK